MSKLLPLQWRYWLDIRLFIVLLLFVLYSCVMYHYFMKGYVRNWRPLHHDKADNAGTDENAVVLGPVYSLQVFFSRAWKTKKDTLNLRAMALAVAKTDVLVLAFAHDDVPEDKAEILDYFSLTQRWQLVLPLGHVQSYKYSCREILPTRRLPLAVSVDAPSFVVVCLKNISLLLNAGMSQETFLPEHGQRSVVVCFLVDQDPSQISLSSGRSLEEEFLADSHESRIPSLLARWGHMNNVSWLFFVFLCQKNQVHLWDKNKFDFFGKFTVWFVCAGSDTLIEASTASGLLTVLSDD